MDASVAPPIPTMAEGKNVFIPLRLVFLSGDWITTTLPKRFYSRSKCLSFSIFLINSEKSLKIGYLKISPIDTSTHNSF